MGEYMRYVLLFIGVLCSLLLLGQRSMNITEGKVFKSSKYGAFERFINVDQNGYYALRQKKAYSSIFLEHYDNELNYLQTNELSLKKDKQKLSFDFIEKLNNRLYMFSSLKDKKTDKKTLFAQSINIDQLTVNNNFKKIVELTVETEGEKSHYFRHITSSDQSIVAAYYPLAKTVNQQFNLTVINNEIEVLWNQIIEFPLDTNHFKLNDVQVDKQGDVYFLGNYISEEGEEYYKCFKYSNAGKKIITYDFDISNHFLLNAKMRVLSTQIVLAGLCAQEKGGLATGTYFISIDQDKGGNNKKVHNFSPLLFEKYLETDDISASEEELMGLKDYAVDYLLLNNDGSFYLIAEQYHVEVEKRDRVSSNGTAMVYSSYNYFYNDLVIVHFSKKGELLWSDKVLKKQFTMNDSGFYSSYAICLYQNKLQIVFNDHIQNLEKNQSMAKYFTVDKENSVLVSVEVNKQGIKGKQQISPITNDQLMTRLKRSLSLQNKQLLLFSIVGKQNKISKITFDD